ncbi:carbohydrate ABC transporter permease [Cytobacillus oceanisediminis]|jgi:putative aldouronate transport system permease protein|uniref:Carbohydrate ABC transporter membrane protein 2 (CUT1 family) n=1 Tax=Cytobacillus oceanisediminis TaxID=665099 RepID=A0A2V3A664_9BACI|nr:carbohydrate ABC transporter permease [Cytobacillus oceanisediminis]PWW32266.1 carbohydrate ABC transporter membrane protein 2 (CUT1 family) [Cytobacillus oceanisediminis]
MGLLALKNKKITRRSKEDKVFDIINVFLVAIILILVVYPLYFIVIASFSDPNMIYDGKVWLLPKELTFEGYERIFQDSKIWLGYKNSIVYTVVGTIVNVSFTLMAAYALSRKDLYGRNVIMFLFLMTMFFSGGLIPTYLVVKNLGLLNTMWALILPKAVAVWNVIVAKTFFETSIPNELLEAAKMDGCSDAKFFWKIVLPLSKPIVAVMVLFYAVGHWNSYFDALIYLNNENLYPLQLILRNILIQNEASTMMISDLDSLAAKQRVSELIKYGVIIVASIPLLIVYPFVQKYFVKGVMIGGIKG